MGYHYENNELTDMLLMYVQCYLPCPESTQSDFRKDTTLGHVSYYVINLVQRRNRQDRTQNFRKQEKYTINYLR
jgi:hypothetical protein